MAIVDSDIFEIADVLLRRNMLKNGNLEQKMLSETNALLSENSVTYKHYISKPYIAELRFKQISSDEFDRKHAKLKLFNINFNINIDELEWSEIKLEGGNSYIMQDLNDEDTLIEIEEEPAFTTENWRLYRKYKDVFKEELDTCMYEITTKESLARAGIELEEIQEEERTLKTRWLNIIDVPDRSSYDLPEEIPTHYVVTISSKTAIEIKYDYIYYTLFTYINLKNTYININDYINEYKITKFIVDNLMLKKLDISILRLDSIKQLAKIIDNCPRLKTIITDLSNIRLNEETLKENKLDKIKIIDYEL